MKRKLPSLLVRESTAKRWWSPSNLRTQGLRSSEWLTKSSRIWSGAPWKYMSMICWWKVCNTDHLQHLDKAFNLLKQYKVKLNLEKCTFGVTSGKFLGYLVTQCGIKADTNHISAILNMKSPTCVKEVQMLNGRLAAHNRFISRFTDKCMPFF